MHQLAEDALADHVEQRHLGVVVAAVFQQHQRDAGLLARAHELPAFIERRRAADLRADDFAMLHGIHGDERMRRPARHNDDRLDVLAGVDLAIIRGAEGDDAARLAHMLLRRLNAILVDIADGRNLHVGHRQQQVELRDAAKAEADDAQTDAAAGSAQFHLKEPPL